MQDGSPERKALDLDDLTEKIEDCEQSKRNENRAWSQFKIAGIFP